ncbi:LuxR C-terminal-related transcriptional regulator [Kitasatospora sp. NPDC086791]|uniref:LuxR C-terminal-related transcriptional regulator n=1 Tax=Kitasatospora sp. NPDC086791 TaxID=3155178 RepID=UPI0034459332
MTTPSTADSPAPKRHRDPARADHDAAGLLWKLTPREAQTLAHLAAGPDLPHTAALLGVTPTTARSYLLRAMRKLGATTQAEAIALAAGSLPHVPPAGPANFVGLTPSSLGPGRTGSTAGPVHAVRVAADGPGGGGGSSGGGGSGGGGTSPAPTGQPATPSPRSPGTAPHTVRHPAYRSADRTADRTATDRAEDGPPGPVAPPGDSRRPAPAARRGRAARRARQERGEAARTPPGERPSARPERTPQPVPAHRGERGGPAQPPSPAAAVTGRPAAAEGRGRLATADRTPAARLPRDGHHAPARTDAASSATAGPTEPASPISPTNTADPGTRPPSPQAPSAAQRQQPSPADRERPASGGAARRGGAAQGTPAATTAKGPQPPSDGGPAQPGTPTPPTSTPPPTPAPAPVAAGGAGDGTTSGEQPPAGTEGQGEVTTHTAPAAAPAAGGPAPAPSPAPSPAPAASSRPADRPVPSFEELYEAAHTRLVQQVFLLTACRHRAVRCVRRAFGEARRGWPAVAGSADPEGWVRVRACELALSPWHRGGPRRAHAWGLPHRRIKVRPADESQAVLPDHDRLTDRDRALLKALKRLSRPQRRALVLHDGLGLPAAAIAVEVESTRAAAEGRVWTARAALAQWVPDLVGPDPAAPGFADGLSLLLHRAAVRGCPEPHRSPVPVLRARHRLWTASRTGAAALLTMAVGGATLATLAGVRPAVLFRPPEPPEPALCLPAAAAQEPGVPVLPGGVPNGISSLWCSPAPGLEAVLVQPHARAVARWELPAAVRGGDAPPPQGPVACPRWLPRPCTTGARTR